MFTLPERIVLWCIAALTLLSPLLAGAEVSASRMWPAEDYTRLTLESDEPLAYHAFSVENPHRLVLDLKNVTLNEALRGLSGKVAADDPHVAGVRVAYFTPDTVRVVLDLKGRAKPSVFTLDPVARYGHRLVLDIYPETPAGFHADPLVALLKDAPGLRVKEEPAGDGDADAGVVAPQKAITTASLAPELGVRDIVVAVDAGHGGEDPGAVGYRGTYEKNVTLAIARKVKKIIDDTPGMRAVLTRDGDYFIPLGKRVAKARKAGADLFVSIHADAFMNTKARGSSVYIVSERGASSAAAGWLAKRENEADLIGGVNLDVGDQYLARTLLDLSQTATINDSMKLAREVLDEMGDVNRLHKRRVEQAGFAVLKAPDLPSILVETAFISNPEEESKLNDSRHQHKLARAIARGIERYTTRHPALARARLAKSDP